MKKDLLLPYQLRKFGYMLFAISATYGLLCAYSTYLPSFLNSPFLNDGVVSSFYDEISMLGAIIGLISVAFSRESTEDEMTQQNRLKSLQWSVYANYAFLIVAVVFVYEGYFLWVLEANIFTILLVFIVRFRWQAIKLNREASIGV